MSIVLIGYRGSGKTTIGRQLADRLSLPFVDTDQMVVAHAGKTIKAIFEEDGEPRFRELETEAVREACGLRESIISLGGGAVLRDENRDAIKRSGHPVVYLCCAAAELHKRIHADARTTENRPSLTHLGGGANQRGRGESKGESKGRIKGGESKGSGAIPFGLAIV